MTASSAKHPFSKSESLHESLKNAATQAEQLSTIKTDPSVTQLFNQQQASQRDINALISNLSELQTPHTKMTVS